MRQRSRWVVPAFSLFLISHGISYADAQTPDEFAARFDSLDVFLAAVAEDEWPPPEDVRWPELQLAFDQELTLRPQSPLAALVRRAAARVDVEAAPVLVRHGEELTINVDTQPRFELRAAIPYLVDIYASVDGGDWFRLGRFRDAGECGARRNIVASKLTSGIHRVHLIADIRFVRDPTSTSDAPPCGMSLQEPADGIQPDDIHGEVIQHERRVLPAVSFGIFPDLLGASSVSVHTLEAGLPQTSVTRWLNGVFAAVPDMRPIAPDDWIAEFCRPEEASTFVGGAFGGWRDTRHAARRHPRAICATLLIGFPDDRVLALRLRVGAVHEDAAIWALEAPTLQDLSIGGSHNVLDIPFLSLLPQLVTLPAPAFPVLDVSVHPRDIRYEPANAGPGDSIVITATVTNVGGRDAPLTTGFVGLRGISAPAVVRDFVADLPAQRTFDVSLRTTMPTSGEIVVQIGFLPDIRMFRQGPYSQLRDVDMQNNVAVKPIRGR